MNDFSGKLLALPLELKENSYFKQKITTSTGLYVAALTIVGFAQLTILSELPNKIPNWIVDAMGEKIFGFQRRYDALQARQIGLGRSYVASIMLFAALSILYWGVLHPPGT